jgi:hypothetical protein
VVDGVPSSTSGMAEDIIALLDSIGWTEHRDLHIVGVSLGGMIAQGGWCFRDMTYYLLMYFARIIESYS